MKLRCNNTECPSRDKVEPENPMFTVRVTVDADGDVCESPRHIDGEHFTCCHCGDDAHWE